MGFDMTSYQQGKARGLQIAWDCIQHGGIDALKHEIQFRDRTKTNMDVSVFQANVALKQCKDIIFEGNLLISLSVLADEFDFGMHRLNEFLVQYNKYNQFFETDVWIYRDYETMLSAKMKRDLQLFALLDDTRDRALEVGQPEREPVPAERNEVLYSKTKEKPGGVKKLSKKRRKQLAELEAKRKKCAGK